MVAWHIPWDRSACESHMSWQHGILVWPYYQQWHNSFLLTLPKTLLKLNKNSMFSIWRLKIAVSYNMQFSKLHCWPQTTFCTWGESKLENWKKLSAEYTLHFSMQKMGVNFAFSCYQLECFGPEETIHIAFLPSNQECYLFLRNIILKVFSDKTHFQPIEEAMQIWIEKGNI